MLDLSAKASSPTNTYGVLMYPKGKGVRAEMFKQLSSIFLHKSELFQIIGSFIRLLLPISA